MLSFQCIFRKQLIDYSNSYNGLDCVNELKILNIVYVKRALLAILYAVQKYMKKIVDRFR